MPASEVSPEFRFGVQPSGCTELEQAKSLNSEPRAHPRRVFADTACLA